MFQVYENCVKAYVHQGRAHLGLKQYDQALHSYEQALKCDPKKESIMTGEKQNWEKYLLGMAKQ